MLLHVCISEDESWDISDIEIHNEYADTFMNFSPVMTGL